ncbi:MAG: thymidylate synthase, partial [Nanoarchaeota archaeon]|nr:thymidylate synthase [Nanoarchaeota archaeon]
GVISLWNIEDVEIDGKKFVNVANCISQLQLARINYKLHDGSYEQRLDMIMTHRSADLPVGAPHDWADWALFQMMVAKELGIPTGTLTANINEGQIYDVQMEQVKELLKREPMKKGSVTIDSSPSGTIYDHSQEDFHLHDYQSHPKMKMSIVD